MQSHTRLGVFSENPRKQPDAKELTPTAAFLYHIKNTLISWKMID